jgi:biotin carboxylase
MEFSVEAFTHNGHHHVAAITEKFKKPNTFMESGHLIPARIGKDENEKICSAVTSYLTALGVKCGPTHTEIMFNGNGVYIIETHTRVGGDQIPALVRLSKGIDLYDLAALQALGKDIEPSKFEADHSQAYACIKFLVQDGNNETITAVEGVSDIEQWPGVKNIHVRYKQGDKLVPVKHSFDRAASVLVVGDSAENALVIADRALANIQIKTDQGV